MKKLIILFLLSACSFIGYSQIAPVEYEVVYNPSTALFEARMHVVSGSLTGSSKTLGPSTYTIVLPGSTPDVSINLVSVNPSAGTWVNTENAFNFGGNDYRFVSTNGGAQFATFNAGDNILLFTFDLGSCVEGVRVYNNGVDPNGMNSGDYRNALQILLGDQYSGNRNEDFFFEQTSPGDWSDTTKWLNGRIPTPYSNVRISHSGVSTISAADQDYVVDNLELLGAGSELVVETGRTLGITRDVTNNGDFTGDGIVELIGPCGPQDLIGTGSYNKLIADNVDGVNVTESTVINGYLNVDNGTFTTNDATTFPCDFNSSTGAPFTRHAVGQIGPVAAGSSIVGNVTVEQCFPGRRAFRLVSPSTTGGSIHNEWQENPEVAQGGYQHNPRPGYGAHITGVVPDLASNALGQQNLDQTNGLDWQPSGNPSMFEFNATGTNAQTFTPLLDTETPTLNAGDPYLMMIRGSRAVNLESNASPTSDTKLESTGTPDVNPSAINPGIGSGEYALIGNPFHAVVDLTQVIPGNGYTGFVTIYDPNIGGTANVNPSSTELGGRGGYVTVDVSGGTTTGNTNIITSGITDVTATDATQFIQPYQAFFVQGSSTGTPGTITFEETDKRVEEIQTDVFSSSQARISVTLFDQVSLNNQDTPDDGLVVYFSPNSSNAVDDNDAPKFFNQDEVIARNENGNLVSFENRAMPVEEDVLELYTDQYRTTNYVLEVGVQFLPNQTVYLHDKYTDTEVLLNNNASNTYAFTVDQSNPGSIATDRFEILFQSTTLGTNDFDLQGLSVYPNPASDILNISFGENTGRFETLELFDISGRLVAKQAISSQLQETQVDVNTFSSGVYLLKVSSGSEEFTTKVIVE